ncbi:MAG: carboxypeptidase regulatory-like domain-containing protein [Calditrichaeota bacterium]|nr:carboxypeptidase regulatory-like domain-containing protein [Calditrichota bacterium]
MKSQICLLHLSAILIFCIGCQWDPPRDNPLDPHNYRYKPSGGLRLVLLDSADAAPIYNAEVRLPALSLSKLTDSAGTAEFHSVTPGRWQVFAERRGENELEPYGLDSLLIDVQDQRVRRDTLKLKALPPTFGRLTAQVLTLASAPIFKATVMLNELGRFAYTDNSGRANFSEVPVGRYWLRAFRNAGFEVTYALDSVVVEIRQGALTSTVIRLDALPTFDSTSVNSFVYKIYEDSLPVYQIHFKAWVDDADGQHTLDSIKWRLETLSARLAYVPDSGFWRAEEPAARFPTAKPDWVISQPVYFEATDRAGYTTTSLPTYLWRVIHDVPRLIAPPFEHQPEFNWNFDWTLSFPDTAAFYYLVRVINRNTNQVVYQKMVTPAIPPRTRHRCEDYLPELYYDWEVWALDYLGNRSRSVRGILQTEFRPGIIQNPNTYNMHLIK